MPDEQSNLNSPRRAGGNRRRGRRGGRGRGPRPPAETSQSEPENAPEAGAVSNIDETVAPAEVVESAETHGQDADNSGGFREPHADVPEDFASHPAAPEEVQPSEPVAESDPGRTPGSENRRPDRRDNRREERREERPPQPPPRIPVSQRPWTKPADFRPAGPTAISQAVEHATFIADALKELHDQMDEVLELVELAERQKLADEREIEELRRALRRIQPQQQRMHQQQQQFHRPQPSPRREEPRRHKPESSKAEVAPEVPATQPETPASPASGTPPTD